MTPRPYQIEAINVISRVKRGVAVLPAGSGKTLIAAWATMKACNARPRERKPIVYAIAPTIEIVQQIQEAFHITGADQVCQFEAFCYAANKSVADADLLIMDEAHRVPSEQGRAWVRQADKACIWGFSATPDRQDGQDICDVIGGSIVYRLDRKELVESGKLAPCKVKWIRYVADTRIQLAISLEAEKKIKSWWAEDVQQKVLYGIVKKHGIELNEARNEAIINQAEKYAKNSTIILVGSIEHGRALQARIGCGEMVYSGMGKKLRATTLERFKRGELRTIIASTVIKEGFDAPIADVIILAKGGRAAGELEQISGRVLRPYEGKQYGIVIDFFDGDVHGMLAAHSWKRFGVYKKLNYEQER